VYACGDCAEIVDDPERPGRVEQLWYTGRMQGEVCGANVAGESQTYVRGVWFNSAKFFDLEWHTYGQVRPAASPRPPGERTYLWQDVARRRLLRVDTLDGAVVGMNALGLRQRQDVWTRWITEGRSMADILPRLGEANFDPEFSGKVLAQAAGALREAQS
jgi:NADPH-dependent 2,4-dienoyl-CoA reductase/sulfur reductase-like enzyme